MTIVEKKEGEKELPQKRETWESQWKRQQNKKEK